MRYMMLIHHDDEAMAKVPQQELYAAYGAFNAALAKAEGGQSGVWLKPASAATTVRVADGRTGVVDGPYADTKEQFAGYFFIEAPDLDAAIKWAEMCPASRYGAIEIRPVMEHAS